MSQENVEIARQSADAIERRDRSAWLALHDQHCEVVPLPDWPESGIRGAEAAWEFYLPIYEVFARMTGRSDFGYVQQIDAGADKVLVHHRPDLRGGEGGADVAESFWCVATIQHGKIVHEHWFTDRAEACAAAELSE